MKDITLFNVQTQAAFENKQDNVDEMLSIMFDASNRVYSICTKEEADTTIRGLFNKISGLNWALATVKQRRQDWRLHKSEYFTIIEDVVADRMQSGWNDNPFFTQFCEIKNLGAGDTNLFTVTENSLMTVSKFSGNHHDLLRQKVGFGKSFAVETSDYYIKCYNDYELFRLGRIDFAKMIDKMYASIDKYRTDAAYVAFMSADESLPTDLVIDTPLTAATRDVVVALASEIETVTGCNVAFVGTKVALEQLAAMVPYDIWSEEMKNEHHNTGRIGVFEGYATLAIPRVNEFNSRKEKTDNTKILIVPINSDFKPVKIVNEGDVAFYEFGMDGSKKDMTIEAELTYREGIAVVINMLYGVVNIESTASA